MVNPYVIKHFFPIFILAIPFSLTIEELYLHFRKLLHNFILVKALFSFLING